MMTGRSAKTFRCTGIDVNAAQTLFAAISPAAAFMFTIGKPVSCNRPTQRNQLVAHVHAHRTHFRSMFISIASLCARDRPTLERSFGLMLQAARVIRVKP